VDGVWQWWLEGRQQITKKYKIKKKLGSKRTKNDIKGDLQGQWR